MNVEASVTQKGPSWFHSSWSLREYYQFRWYWTGIPESQSRITFFRVHRMMLMWNTIGTKCNYYFDDLYSMYVEMGMSKLISEHFHYICFKRLPPKILTSYGVNISMWQSSLTENRELSECQLCRQWRHQRLSWWQTPVQAMTKMLAAWRLWVETGEFVTLTTLSWNNCSFAGCLPVICCVFIIPSRH